jgi:PAS domain S-box-containing protein
MNFPSEQKSAALSPAREPASVQILQQQLADCNERREAAQRAQEHCLFFTENVRDYAFITFDREAHITSWSRGAEHIFGYSEDEALGQDAGLIFTVEDRTAGASENELKTAQDHGCAENERWHLRRDGTLVWTSGILTAHWDGQRNLQGYSKVLRDHTARRLKDEQLRESEERLRLFSQNVTDYALVALDSQGNVSGWNTGAERIFGYAEREIVGQPAARFFVPEDVERGESARDLDRAITQGRAEDARWMMRCDGSRFWARWVTTPIRVGDQLRGFTKVLRDETDRKRAEDLVQISLQNKDLLLREIHHRVKNHLQVIASLVSMQADQAEGLQVQGMFEELKDRVRAIGSLHETLYSSEDLANIDFGPYMVEILNGLTASYGVQPSRVDLRVETDDIVLSIEQALPLGLIVNELVSNALKHGYSGARRGSVYVSFRYLMEFRRDGDTLDDGWCELVVQNDGASIENPDGIWERTSMGLRIVRLLTQQLRGTVALYQSEGTRFAVRFPLTLKSHAGAVS